MPSIPDTLTRAIDAPPPADYGVGGLMRENPRFLQGIPGGSP